MLEENPRKILKKTLISPDSKPDRLFYLNLTNGVIYDLNPKLIEQLGVEIVDGSTEITTLDDLRKESLRIMDEYIRSSCY